MRASFSGGMSRGTLKTARKKETLWNNIEPFVNANISYVPSERHIWQLSFSSEGISTLLGIEQQRLLIECLFRSAGKPVVEACLQIQHPIGVLNKRYMPDYISQDLPVFRKA
ncbi:hypothetical protein [Proteiniphilum sp. UBA5384]|uniref:hypothetical protein n=1 Tax=Proteiniphilum sp. UBA5384 TaxID=1947279 RepID=UPI0025E4DA0F|nr:hypothetical protein [Proteiniphilum sp. UBA5384]